MMNILRDHYGGICMHGAFRTTASQVSYISENSAVYWMTGSPDTCISIFKPFPVPSQDKKKVFDFWEKRNRFNEIIQENDISKLHSLEQKLIDLIYQKIKTAELSIQDINNFLLKALDYELSVISMNSI